MIVILFKLNFIYYMYITEEDDEIHAIHKYNKDTRKLKIKI